MFLIRATAMLPLHLLLNSWKSRMVSRCSESNVYLSKPLGDYAIAHESKFAENLSMVMDLLTQCF